MYANPEYIERVHREQYNVAQVYISNKLSRFGNERKDIEYSGYVPLDNRYLVDMHLLSRPGDANYYASYYDAPEIHKMNEEEIIKEIQNTAATKNQKAALFDMAKKRNREEFYYSYLEDPRYSNIVGKGK